MTKLLSSITALAAALLLQALSSSSFTPTTIGISLSAASRTIQKLHSQQNPNDDNGNGIELNRRSFNKASAAAALSTLLVTSSNVPFLPVSPALAAYEDTKPKQRILITGSNSGIGLDAAQRLALRGHEVILACVSCRHMYILFACRNLCSLVPSNPSHYVHSKICMFANNSIMKQTKANTCQGKHRSRHNQNQYRQRQRRCP